jgi:hypothetical protein
MGTGNLRSSSSRCQRRRGANAVYQPTLDRILVFVTGSDGRQILERDTMGMGAQGTP